MIRVRPHNDYLFVRETKTPYTGMLVLIERDKPWEVGMSMKQGEILAVGPGRVNKRGVRTGMWGLQPGQRISFSPNGNYTQVVDGEEVTVIQRDSIAGIIVEETDGRQDSAAG